MRHKMIRRQEKTKEYQAKLDMIEPSAYGDAKRIIA